MFKSYIGFSGATHLARQYVNKVPQGVTPGYLLSMQAVYISRAHSTYRGYVRVGDRTKQAPITGDYYDSTKPPKNGFEKAIIKVCPKPVFKKRLFTTCNTSR